MSILIEKFTAGVPARSGASSLCWPSQSALVWQSPTRGSIVALDAADAFAALLHRRIMAESVRIERAVRDSRD